MPRGPGAVLLLALCAAAPAEAGGRRKLGKRMRKFFKEVAHSHGGARQLEKSHGMLEELEERLKEADAWERHAREAWRRQDQLERELEQLRGGAGACGGRPEEAQAQEQEVPAAGGRAQGLEWEPERLRAEAGPREQRVREQLGEREEASCQRPEERPREACACEARGLSLRGLAAWTASLAGLAVAARAAAASAAWRQASRAPAGQGGAAAGGGPAGRQAAAAEENPGACLAAAAAADGERPRRSGSEAEARSDAAEGDGSEGASEAGGGRMLPPAAGEEFLTGEEFLLVHAASERALQAQTFATWPGDESGWGGPPFSNISDTAEFKSLSPLSDASRFRWSGKGDTIHLAERPRLGIEATYREFDFSGNRVMLWGPHHHGLNWYSTFRGNSDGTISPKTTSKDLVLGFGRCLQTKHGFHGDRDQCILVPRGDARQLVVQPVPDAGAGPRGSPLEADYFSFKTGGDPGRVVDRFRAARAGDILTFFRDQPHPGPGAQPGPLACESYTIQGGSLCGGAVSAAVMPNGDLAWSHGYTSRRCGGAAAAPAAAPPAAAAGSGPSVTGRGGRWTEYADIDMCGQGDVEIIPDWRSHTTLEDLKRTVELKGYSAITVSGGHPSFGHAALKRFPYQLTKEHCKPISTCCGHPCRLFIYDPTAADAALPAPAGKVAGAEEVTSGKPNADSATWEGATEAARVVEGAGQSSRPSRQELELFVWKTGQAIRKLVDPEGSEACHTFWSECGGILREVLRAEGCSPSASCTKSIREDALEASVIECLGRLVGYAKGRSSGARTPPEEAPGPGGPEADGRKTEEEQEADALDHRSATDGSEAEGGAPAEADGSDGASAASGGSWMKLA